MIESSVYVWNIKSIYTQEQISTFIGNENDNSNLAVQAIYDNTKTLTLHFIQSFVDLMLWFCLVEMKYPDQKRLM